MKKIIYIILIILLNLSCTKNAYLVNTKFCEYYVFSNNMHGNFLTYKFFSKTYQIDVLIQEGGPTKVYRIEEGKYSVRDSIINLIPQIQLICLEQLAFSNSANDSIKVHIENVTGLCIKIWAFENSYRINKDSLRSEEKTKFEFIARRARIKNNDGLVYITDPKFPHKPVKLKCRD